jgi:hypothetical protein
MEKALEYFAILLSWPQGSERKSTGSKGPIGTGNSIFVTCGDTKEVFVDPLLVSVLPMCFHNMCEGYRRAKKIQEMNDFIQMYHDFIDAAAIPPSRIL